MRSTVSRLCLLVTCLMACRTEADEIANDGALLTPYLSSTTLLVARLDVSKVDADAILAWEMLALKASNADKRTLKDGEVAFGKLHQATKQWAAAFLKSGGRRVYAVADLSLLPNNPVVFLVPVEAGADAATLQTVMRYGEDHGPAKATPDDSAPQVVLVDNKLILMGEKPSVTAIMHLKSAARLTLLKILSAGDDSAVKWGFEMTDELREMGNTFLPVQLPQEFGGGKTVDLMAGIVSSFGTLSPPPQAALNVSLHCTSPETAQLVNTVYLSAMKVLAISPMIGEEYRLVPDKDPNGQAMTAFLTPAINGADLSLSRDTAAVDKQLAPLMAKSNVRAYQTSLRVVGLSQIRQLLTGGIMYAIDHKGAFPDELTAVTIGDYLGGEESAKKLLSNPRHPDLNPAYVYIKPAKNLRNPGETVVIYEAADKENPDDSISVGYADGHCEVLSRKEFEKVMAKAAGGL